ncbi:MAG: glutamate-1-semialdehyde 2,1-aminomutase [Chitinophagaceae bacterium]|nr:glutamate-1-semialdehyde 2,1-aminomutase [Chitinophagaceae bacterium]
MNYSEKLHSLIPGGAHTYSRGDDQFPDNAPQILSHGIGCHVWDAEGRKFIDYGMGLRSVNIGYGNKEIADAALQEILKGNNLTRASLTELKAAETLTELISSADMVKFAKHGSTVTTAALKLARAYTKRKFVAVPYEHPFFSFDDWFIGSTVMNLGVPDDISKLTLKFHYNDITSLQKLFDEYPEQIACVMLEPATTVSPILENGELGGKNFSQNEATSTKRNFLHSVKNLCHKNGAVFIIDEMITGFRWHINGAQKYFDITPDLSTFGKAMANGFAVAALTGKREIMQLGGIKNEGMERIFLTSTTHGAEMSALGAFIKTIDILRRDNGVEYIWNYGSKLMSGLNDEAKKLSINDFFYCEGYPCSPAFVTKDAEGKISLPFRTLFQQEMINNGILIPYIAISLAHTEDDLNKTIEAARISLRVYKKALESGMDGLLKSRVIKPVFRKYN